MVTFTDDDFWADGAWPPEAKAPFRQAYRMVRENWSAIERLASALDERDGNMPASHVVGFIENPRRPTIWERIVK